MEKHQDKETSNCPPSFSDLSSQSHLFGIPWEPSTRKTCFTFKAKNPYAARKQPVGQNGLTQKDRWFT